MRVEEGRVVLPREQFAALDFDEAEYFRELGVEGATGEEGYTALERRWARPTYDINGSDFPGPGTYYVVARTTPTASRPNSRSSVSR